MFTRPIVQQKKLNSQKKDINYFNQLYNQIQVYCIIIAIWLILQSLLQLEIINLRMFLMFKQIMFQKKNLHIKNQLE
ncbi:unnamed protein product [Paramecium primaurelia]|uniref:Transmembrane protein n=1 Tax=Paramecium primaurelia TaxID=5886 RepID=A0A8S1MTJ6_PARPR|nr:unnamed protein product [Paramecium primaurelia]